MLSFKPALSLSSLTFMNGSRSSVLLSTHFTKDFLLVTRNSSYHEEISCFSKYEEMQGLESWNQFLKVSSYLKTCPTRFPGARSASLRPELPEGALKVNSCSSTGLTLPQSQMAHALVQSLAMLLASASLWKCKCYSVFVIPVGHSPSDSSVPEILQARMLEWAAISFSRGIFPTRGQTWVFHFAGRFFIIWATEDSIL